MLLADFVDLMEESNLWVRWNPTGSTAEAPEVNSKTFSRVNGLHSPAVTQESCEKYIHSLKKM